MRRSGEAAPESAGAGRHASAAGGELPALAGQGAASATRSASPAPGQANRLFIVQQSGTHPDPPERQAAGDGPSSTSRGCVKRAASRACWAWPSTRTTRATAGSTSTTRTARTTARVVEYRRASATARANPASARLLLCDGRPLANHNGGALAVRPRRAALHRHGRRRRRRRPAGQRPEPRHAARQDPAHRRRLARGRQAVRHPGGQPVRRPRGGAAGDLRLRPAQPVALLVRPRDAATSGSATSGRTPSRRSTSGPRGTGARRQLRLERLRGPLALRRRRRPRRAPRRCPVAEYTHARGCSITGGYVYRGTRVPALRGRYVFADFCIGSVWTMRAGPKPGRQAQRHRAPRRHLSNVTVVRRGPERRALRARQRLAVPLRPPVGTSEVAPSTGWGVVHLLLARGRGSRARRACSQAVEEFTRPRPQPGDRLLRARRPRRPGPDGPGARPRRARRPGQARARRPGRAGVLVRVAHRAERVHEHRGRGARAAGGRRAATTWRPGSAEWRDRMEAYHEARLHPRLPRARR